MATSWAVSQKRLRVTMVSSLISPLIDWALIRLITERLPSRFTARWIEVMRLARPKNGEFTSFRRAPERPGSWLISLAMFFRSGLGMTCSICRSTMIWGLRRHTDALQGLADLLGGEFLDHEGGGRKLTVCAVYRRTPPWGGLLPEKRRQATGMELFPQPPGSECIPHPISGDTP